MNISGKPSEYELIAIAAAERTGEGDLTWREVLAVVYAVAVVAAYFTL